MTQVVRPWRGVSAEERRARRRELLLEACLNVVGADGVAAVTVDKICAGAGLTKRYFYESFPDLDVLLVATLDRLTATMREQMDAAVARIPAGPERAHAIVTILIDVLSGDPRHARLYVESPGHPALRRRREEAVAAFTDFVVRLVAPDPDVPGPRRLLAARLVVGGTTDLVTSWLAGDIGADRAAIVETIEQAGRAALGG